MGTQLVCQFQASAFLSQFFKLSVSAFSFCSSLQIVERDGLLVRILGGPFAELHCFGSGIQFELPGSRFLRIALDGNAHYMGKPIYRGTREVQLAAQREQVAPTFPLIRAQQLISEWVKRGKCNLPPKGDKLHRHVHSSLPISKLAH